MKLKKKNPPKSVSRQPIHAESYIHWINILNQKFEGLLLLYVLSACCQLDQLFILFNLLEHRFEHTLHCFTSIATLPSVFFFSTASVSEHCCGDTLYNKYRRKLHALALFYYLFHTFRNLEKKYGINWFKILYCKNGKILLDTCLKPGCKIFSTIESNFLRCAQVPMGNKTSIRLLI